MQPVSYLFHKGRGMKDLEGALKDWLISQLAAKYHSFSCLVTVHCYFVLYKANDNSIREGNKIGLASHSTAKQKCHTRSSKNNQ